MKCESCGFTPDNQQPIMCGECVAALEAERDAALARVAALERVAEDMLTALERDESWAHFRAALDAAKEGK